MPIRPVILYASLALSSLPALAGDGLRQPAGDQVWPQWQARITLQATTWAPVSLVTAGLEQPVARSAAWTGGALLGDYYFRGLARGDRSEFGGLRATTGLLIGGAGPAIVTPSWLRGGQRLSLALQTSALAWGADSAPDSVATPYFGIGYTGLSLKGGYSISADIGLTVANLSAGSGFNRAPFGNQGLESARRELRLSPVLQLGVSYAF